MLNRCLEEIHAPPSFDGSEGLLAIIVRKDFSHPGTHFFTSPGDSLQVGSVSRLAGEGIEPHVHTPLERTIRHTSEVLFVRKGRIRVDFYTSGRAWVAERYLQAGDMLLLVSGGHGFRMLEDTELFESKSGPYVGERDKVRFEGITRR